MSMRRFGTCLALSAVVITLGCGGGDDASSDLPATTVSRDDAAHDAADVATTSAAAALEDSVDGAGPSTTRVEIDPATGERVIISDSEPGSPSAGGAVGTDSPATTGQADSPLAEPEPLSDGTHFGYVTSVDERTRTIGFDVARLLRGAEATEAALRAGVISSADTTLPGGVFVSNNAVVIRDLVVAPSARILTLAAPDRPTVVASSLAQLSALLNLARAVPNSPGLVAHVEVTGSQITGIEQFSLPTS